MFSKKSNRNLWILFIVLLIAVILIFSTESTKKERSFRKDIVSVDTSAVSSMIIYPKSKPGMKVELLNSDGIWKVLGENSKSYTVPKSKIENLFNQLLMITPKRVAARSKSKWTEYQVDSSATRIVVNEDGSEALNLVIGKFSFQQPRSMSTYVRLWDENEVYEVDGFLEMTFNKDINSFRDETIIKSNKDEWTRLLFESTENESLELLKIDNKWTLNGLETDSAKTVKALNDLSRLTSTDFIDDREQVSLPPQLFSLTIETSESQQIQVFGYKDNSRYLVYSSQNPENYFDGNKLDEK
ncbi:MAG: DUF4340 domain-containing protein, partial [Melioribacteraceae bacterium]|nr:DUF4340 domain-containing protein [Melioribacteraceae bacterium]